MRTPLSQFLHAEMVRPAVSGHFIVRYLNTLNLGVYLTSVGDIRVLTSCALPALA